MSIESLYLTAVLLSSAFALAVAAWLWSDEMDLSARLFLLMVLLHPLTGVFVVGELLAPTRELATLFYGFHAATSAGVPVAFFLFALAFASRRRRLPRPLLAVFVGYLVVVAGLQATNPLHGLAWGSYEVVGETVPHVQAVPTDGFMILSFPLFFLYYAAMGVLGYRFLARQGGEWRQTVALFVGFAMPFVVSSLWFVGALPGPLDGAFVIGSTWMFAFVGWAVFRYQLFDVVPLARETVFEELDEMVIVVDRDRRLLDYNPPAAETFPALAGETGTPIEALLPEIVAAGDGIAVVEGDGGAVDGAGAVPCRNVTDVEGEPHPSGCARGESDAGGEDGAGSEGDATATGDGDVAGGAAADDDATGPFVRSFTRYGASDTREYTVAVSPLTVDGDVQGYAAVVRDVTDRRRQRRDLEQQKDQLERFASTLSHDLRNPLNVAQGRAEMALERDSVEELPTVVDALDRIDEMIDDLLTLSREGRTIDDPGRVELAAVAERAWATVDTREATLEIDPAAEVAVYADETRLRNVFENLFRNALEHGGPSVTVRIGRHADGFVVEDDGPGIPVAARERVFDYEFTTAEDGNGLGLAIVDAIARAHGWSVEATEGSDGGARFVFADVDVVAVGDRGADGGDAGDDTASDRRQS